MRPGQRWGGLAGRSNAVSAETRPGPGKIFWIMKYSSNIQIIKYFSSRNIFVHCNIFDNKIFLIKFDKQIFHLIIFLKRKHFT